MQIPQEVKDKHFLICDDYESMRVMIVNSLKTLGITKITVAKSGTEGFQKIKASLKADPIQFVMTDLMMDDGSGIDLARLIRADAETKHLPILMMTSKSEVNYMIESIKAGVNTYLIKPWQMEDLAKKITDLALKKK